MKLLSLARDLQRRRARERHGLFVAEGLRAVEELLRSPLRLHGALAAPDLVDTARGLALRAALDSRAIPVLDVTAADFTTAASTAEPQGILAVATIPRRTPQNLVLPESARLLVLDAVQDPGNAGTLVRTAAALGATATFALPGTVDLWNSKVVRSAMGALFHHPVFQCAWETLDEFVRAHDIPLWAADRAGESCDGVSSPPSMALIVSNEGAGLSSDAARRAVRRIGVPLAPEIESLNVAVAAGILLHHFHA
ncbi:MAG: TrmH family RNA methyltransferase [Gemmatimonadaceae bacterium]